MMSAYRTVSVTFLLLTVLQLVYGNTSWTLHTNPTIFGKDFQLQCTLSGDSSISNTQQQPTGIETTDIHSLNGEQVKDGLHNAMKIFTLSIKTYNKNGQNIPYKCQHVTQNGNVLNTTVGHLKYNPKPTDSSYNNTGKLFSVKFENIDQLPRCTVLFGHTNLTKQLQTTSKVNDAATVYLHYDHDSHKCPQALKATCHVGTNRIVQNLEPTSSACSEVPAKQTQQEKEDKDQSVGIIGLVVFSLVSIVYVGGFIIGICMSRCRRN